MRKIGLVLFLLSALALAQDASPSLGDVARQTRQQKQQREAQAAKDAQNTAGENSQNAEPKVAKRIITNEEIPERLGPANVPAPPPQSVTCPQANQNQAAAQQIKSQILQMKNYVASLQSQIANLENSVHYSGSNCVYGCAQWNTRQQQKQEQADAMKQQLAQYEKNLEHQQEMARRQGYGSAIYDP